MNKFYLSLVIAITSVSVFAQEESEACIEPSKKVMKLINEAKNESNPQEAVVSFQAAIQLDKSNATAYYEFGMYAFNKGLEAYERNPNPKAGDNYMNRSEAMLLEAYDKCHDFNANIQYCLGVINFYQQEQEEAITWFKRFVEYKNDDNSRYPEDYGQKLADVKEVLADLEQEQEVLSEEVPFKPQIVKNVSSHEQEYFPMISPDNELMFFTRKLDRRNLGDLKSNVVEEFTGSYRPNMTSEFDAGTPLPAPFNDGSVQSYGAATLSVDNKEMILCACKKEEVYGQPYMNCDLYITHFERTGKGGNDFTWTPLENMGDKINTNNGWEAQPSLSADGNTLYYTVNRPTSRDNDIYVAHRGEDGEWGQAVPFDVINTDGKDKSPFLHQDSETLYFVSQCTKERPGVGGLDIFYIRQQQDGSWTEPKNIGYPINSPDDELGLFVSIDGEIAYYSSRVGGNWNIYSFELYEEARPKSVAILKGELKDEDGNPVKDATIEIAYEGNDAVETIKVNGDDGKYAAIVKTEKKQDIMVTVKKEGHAFDSKLIEKEEIASLDRKEDVAIRGNDLNVKELKKGGAYTINDILFATNSYDLNLKSKFILKGFARFLVENPTITVAIQGHTDDIGDDSKNMKLSSDRANEVKRYLISLGIDKSRLTAEGFGETQPKVENDSEVNRAKNRRTDFVIESL